MKPTILEVPGAVYAAIRAIMEKAGYTVGLEGRVAMHGVVLKERPGGTGTGTIAVSTLLSSRTKEGRVEFAINGELTQLDLPKAREVVRMLQEAIEAAASDQMLYTFMTERIGLDNEKASMALLDFREIRQGSRGLVHPS